MSTIEDRLSAALTARADQVQPEDLRPASPPPNVVPLHRRPATWLVAAAACTALVATPLVLLGDDGDRSPVPPATQTPEPTPKPNGDDVRGADWPLVVERDGYDVDGDGAQDRVVTRTASGENVTQEPWRLEVQLAAGGTTAIVLDEGWWEVGAVEPVEVNGAPGDEILYYNGQETQEMGVFQYADGELVDLVVPDDPGLTSQVDDEGRMRARWVRDGVLWSSRSVGGGVVPGGSSPLGNPYEVETWTWVSDGARLVAIPAGRQCVEVSQEANPFPCGGNQR